MADAPLDPEGFATETGVSRETLERIRLYATLLTKWTARIDLVAPSTLPDLWRRHLLDSAQLHPLLPPDARRLVDLGSGGGFPGLVLAILGAPDVHLVESDQRKCAFLREVARATGTAVTIHAARIEAAAPLAADVVTARALAPLDRLLGWAVPHLAPGGVCLFLKGARNDDELTAASRTWTMGVDPLPSRSDPSGRILRLTGIARVTSGHSSGAERSDP
jgi:16S rRNA (guanine527-N7)-methyltransferase